MVKSQYDFLIKKLTRIRNFCISRDETRPYLNGTFFCPEEKAAVSTDGHVMLVSKTLYNEKLSGLIIKNDMTIVERDYPKYKSSLPVKYENSFEILIRKCFFTKGKTAPDRSIFFSKSGKVSFDMPENFAFCIDGGKLKEIADGGFYKFEFNGELSPVKITISDDDFMIIAPIKVN